MTGDTLGARLRRLDRARFVGREAELRRLDALMAADDPDAAVVLVHGQSGIGKSTLLREVARRAEEAGRQVREIDGRDFAPVPGEIEGALAGVEQLERPLLVFDHWERISALGAHLRRRVLPELPDRTVVLLASRVAPEPEWGQGGWEHLTLEVPLGPLADTDAAELLRDRGMDGDGAIRRALTWAEGSPLGLVILADAQRGGEPEIEGSPEAVGMLLRRIGETELDGGNLDVAAVAAIARTTTRGLLRDVLPDVDAEAAERWLAGLSFAERSGPGVKLHDLARAGLRADLRLRAPERERELRRRIADHLYHRAMSGNPRLIVDLADLLENPEVRWGFGADGSVDFRVDELRPGDIEAMAEPMLSHFTSEWWDLTVRLERAPERVVVARDRADALAGWAFAVTPDNAPAAADEDGVLGPWLRHARATVPDGDALIWSDSVDLTSAASGDVLSPVLSLMNTAAFLRSGVTSPRFLYLPIDRGNAAAVAFAAAIGAVRIPELDVNEAGTSLECHVLDTGPGGLLASTRAAVYAELGLAPPTVAEGEAPPPVPAGAYDGEAVKDALRSLHRPLDLAASPLAAGRTTEEKARSVRAIIDEAVERAFGTSDDEELLRSIIRRGYLDGTTSHEAVADELYLSRATYFRRLRQASNRVVSWVLARQAD